VPQSWDPSLLDAFQLPLSLPCSASHSRSARSIRDTSSTPVAHLLLPFRLPYPAPSAASPTPPATSTSRSGRDEIQGLRRPRAPVAEVSGIRQRGRPSSGQRDPLRRQGHLSSGQIGTAAPEAKEERQRRRAPFYARVDLRWRQTLPMPRARSSKAWPPPSSPVTDPASSSHGDGSSFLLFPRRRRAGGSLDSELEATSTTSLRWPAAPCSPSRGTTRGGGAEDDEIRGAREATVWGDA
jgi:hypothetical protein